MAAIKSGRKSAEPVTINKRFVNSVRPPLPDEGRACHWDAQVKGFGLKVYPTGRLVYVLQYRMKTKGAKTQTSTIGVHGSPWSPDSARERALDMLEDVRKGIDPNAVAAATAAEAIAASADETERLAVAARYDVDAFLDRYIDRHVRKEAVRSLDDIKGTFDRDIRPRFRGRSVLDISKAEIQAMRADVGERSTSAANKAHKWFSAAYMWGIEHDGLDSTPFLGLKRPFKEPKRERALADWEIALIWSVLPLQDWRFAMLERILIITGLRLREVAEARWEEFDLEKGEWIIPGTRTKNKHPHLVPIFPALSRLLLAIEPDPDARTGLLLTTNGTTAISGFSKSKAAIDRAVDEALGEGRWSRRHVMDRWVRHDHRRTLSTGFGELKIPLEHAEAVLNHVSGTLAGVAGTYWLYKYAPEKRTALRKWSARVEKILTAHGVDFLPAV